MRTRELSVMTRGGAGRWAFAVLLAGIPSVAKSQPSDAPAFCEFETIIIDKNLPDDPYGIDIADMNGDGRLDILLTRFTEVLWYEAPEWKRHSIVREATRQNCYGLAGVIDGEPPLDVAIASEWAPNSTTSGGKLSWAKGLAGDGAWPVTHIHDEPTMHRMRWADTDGDGIKELIALPLKGKDTTAPHHAEVGVRLLLFRVPKVAESKTWAMEVIDDSLHVAHNVQPVQFDGDRADELLVVSFEGVFLFDRGETGKWMKRQLGEGEQKTSPSRGAGEVAFGKLNRGQRFLATVEPWHGHEVVVYIERENKAELWKRFMLDDTLDQGHGIDVGDLDGDGDDEIVAGYRGANKEKGEPTSLKAYDAINAAAGKWQAHWIDKRDMATEDVRVVDMNADGKVDIVAAGRATRNLKLYLNRKRSHD